MRARLVAGLALALLAAPWAPTAEEEGPPRPSSRVPPTPVDFDLRVIRNIFRYGDDPAPEPVDRPLATAAAVEPEDVPAAAPQARLVGLVRRLDRLLAALSVDGEVVVLARGQSAAGFTVLSVTEEAVRLQGPGGEESVIHLP